MVAVIMLDPSGMFIYDPVGYCVIMLISKNCAAAQCYPRVVPLQCHQMRSAQASCACVEVFPIWHLSTVLVGFLYWTAWKLTVQGT